MPGRRPKPTHLKILNGNPGKRKINRKEPKAAAGIRSCPSYLNRAAKQEWKRVMKESPDGLLTELDRATLAMYCQNVARIAELEKIVEAEGFTFMSEKGYICQRPEMGMLKNLQTIQKGLCAELGFSPSSRSKVTITPKTPEKDPAEEELFGQRGA
jgi:P27 family predicted phage terminase small subunit